MLQLMNGSAARPSCCSTNFADAASITEEHCTWTLPDASKATAAYLPSHHTMQAASVVHQYVRSPGSPLQPCYCAQEADRSSATVNSLFLSSFYAMVFDPLDRIYA